MVLEASGTTLENLQKIIRKHRSERLFGPIFSNFPMLAHVLSLRGDSRAHYSLNSLTRRAYTVCFRVIRRQRGARLNFSVNRHFEEIRASGSQVGDVLHNRLSP